MTKTKYVYNIRTYAGNEDQGTDLIENYEVIANNDKEMEKYLYESFDLKGFTDMSSDPEFWTFEKTYKAWCSDHGNIHEVTEPCEECNKVDINADMQLCEDHFWYNESVTVSKEKPKKADLEYMLSDRYFKQVVDLTQ